MGSVYALISSYLHGSTSYIYGPGGLPIESISSTGVPLFFHHDQLGNTTMLTSAVGAKVAAYTYSSFGLINSYTPAQPLLYAGQYRDAESGLYYLRARYYDPALGQFLTVDPALSTTHQPYSYSMNNPVNVTDGNGMNPALTDLGYLLEEVTGVSTFRGIRDAIGSRNNAIQACATYGDSSTRCGSATYDYYLSLLKLAPGGDILFGEGHVGSDGAWPLVYGPGCLPVQQASPLSGSLLQGSGAISTVPGGLRVVTH